VSLRLSEFARSVAGTRVPKGRLIDVDSELFGKTHELIGSESQTETFWGASFWQIVLASPEFRSLIKANGFSTTPYQRTETIVVPTNASPSDRYNTFFDLVILSQSYSGPAKAFPFRISDESLAIGHRNWIERMRADNNRLVNSGMITRKEAARRGALTQHFTTEFTVKLLMQHDFRVVLAPLPELQFTTVPPSAWSVSLTTMAGSASTAGALVRDSTGNVGVTACRHGILGGTIGGSLGAAVTVNGLAGIVKSEDVVSDSCFIEMAASSIPPHRRTSLGPLVGKAPRVYEDAKFDGIASGSAVTARVSGFSPDIPIFTALSQLKVFTDAVTSPGDSGAALIDPDGYILGFAFWVTSPGANPSMSAWIWADSVFQAHGLSII
jgi:hypothetical protein